MLWACVTIETASQAVEAVTAMLADYGVTGVIIEDAVEMKQFLQDNPQNWDYVDEELMNTETLPTRVKFYLPADSSETITFVENGLARFKENDYGLDMGSLRITTDIADDAGWLENWKKYYKPFRVGKNIIIRPFWEEYAAADSDIVFTINPGNVFGTGLHQSTKLCIEFLEEIIKPGMTILDIGCGSGILSVIAMLLGAGRAHLLDIDPAARAAAYENAKRNDIDTDNFNVITGNILTEGFLPGMGKTYDVIIANIVADVVIELASVVKKLTLPGGIFISSGIIDERLDGVLNALTQNGFTNHTVKTLDGWCAVGGIL